VHITVHQHGTFVVVSGSSSLGAGDCVLDGAARAWFVELGPRRGDELAQPRRLLGAGREAGIGCASPDP
jgi:hypothetical protein